jgi:hypothetical protein
MAGSSAAAATAKPNGAGAGGITTSIQLAGRAAMIRAGRRRCASRPSFQLHESKSLIAPMNTFLTMVLAVAVLVVPLACAYAIVVRLARRRTRGH